VTKKELEKKIADLEARMMELQSQLLTLSLQQQPTFVPTIQLKPQPYEYPCIGDYPSTWPTITCGNISVANDQRFKIWN